MAKCRVNWGAVPEGSSVSVFEVTNTSMKHLFVIAENEKSAMAIAHTANHVFGTHEIHEDNYFRAAHGVNALENNTLLPFSDAIELAIARRLQGTLHFDNAQLSVGNEVILG